MGGEPTPFSAVAREGHWNALGSETWDVLVIGGGATGAGVARDAAGRGFRTALVEAGDFARGTSSRSSRLIHGGLRYLETMELGLVFEASAERRRLLALAPHLVQPLPFLFPVFHGGVGLRKLQAGMWLYDLLALFRNIRRHRMLSRDAVVATEPGLRRDGLRGGAIYYDAAVDDARLTLATARAAHEAGAATVSHAAVVALPMERGTVRGARVRDALTGRMQPVAARVVVNAAGPWSDTVRQLADPGAAPRLRPTKGVHLMLARDRLRARHAIIFHSSVDDRVMFVLPWGERVYVGTTDTDFRGAPDEAEADATDVAYLLDSANALFPEARLSSADVLSTWAGVRPLLAPLSARDAPPAGATSREHRVWRDPSGLLNVAGGKLTTFRVMAAEVTDAAAALLHRGGNGAAPRSRTARQPLPGTPSGDWREFRDALLGRAAEAGVAGDIARHLADAYGAEADAVLERVRDDPALGERIVAEHPYVWAEVDHAVEREMALTLADVMERRLHLFTEARDGGMQAARRVAERMARLPGLGWDAARVEAETAGYRAAVDRNREPAAIRPPPR